VISIKIKVDAGSANNSSTKLTINVSNLLPGVYFISFNGTNKFKKFIKT